MPDPDCPDDETPLTLCDGDKVNNVWVPGHDPDKGVPGICMLDTMNEAQITDILKHDEVARRDLRRVTTNAELLALADTVKRLPTEDPGDKAQREAMERVGAGAYYTQFQGRWPSR